MIAVATMDHNADILRVIGHLREIGSAWRGGDELRRSFSTSLLSIVDTISRSNDALYSITYYMKTKRQEYADGLSHNEIKKLKITKEHIYTLFRVHGTDDIPKSRRTHILFAWCICQPIIDHWIDIWYMVF